MTSSKPRNSLSLSEQLALLENPAPTDFDPEAPEEDYNHSEKSEGSGDEENEDLGRAHYITVGKSKLRKGNPVLSDPKYNGARISREKLYRDEDEDHRMDGSDDDSEDSDGDGSEEDADEKEARNRENGEIPTDEDDDIDSDDALGSDEDKFSGFKFLGSSTTKGGVKATRGMKVVGDSSSDGESGTDPDNDAILNEEKDTDEDDSSDVESDLLSHNEDGDEEDEDEDEDEDGEDEDESSDEGAQDADTKRREELKKLITEEQKNVVANISKAVKADTEKGTAVKQQQKIFDSLLGVRIKLQKAIVAANSLPAPSQPAPSHQPVSETYKAAEDAALNLWNTLTDLRCELSSSSALKRKHDDADTSTSALWAKMQKLEEVVHINRLSTLDKWSAKTSSVSTGTLARKLNNTAQRGLTATISETLMTDLNRHVQKTRVPRSCAPTKVGSGEDVEVYDDSDFYQMLLKALVDQRMVDNANSGGASGAIRWTTALRDAKVKKVVDTKASKGRKLKYQVQEKLQNFMAPIANNSWNEHQIDELFGSLLGQRVRVDEDSEEEEEVELDGLRLFKS